MKHLRLYPAAINSSGCTTCPFLMAARLLRVPSFHKQWQVKNNGTCNWDETYSIKLTAGDRLGASSPQQLVPARGGSEAVIQIQFTAPAEAGQISQCLAGLQSFRATFWRPDFYRDRSHISVDHFWASQWTISQAG